MYFSNSDSYKSATSGFLTIFSVLVLSVVFYYIFAPIFRKELYKSEIKQIKIRSHATEFDCTNCIDFTVDKELEYLFNGYQSLLIYSSIEEKQNYCERFSLEVSIGELAIYKIASFPGLTICEL